MKREGKLNSSKKVVSFRESAVKNLFDISLCKCKDFLICTCKIKVPVAEKVFLTDQRTFRRKVIGNIDIKASKKLEKRLQRKEKAAERSQNVQLQDLSLIHI